MRCCVQVLESIGKVKSFVFLCWRVLGKFRVLVLESIGKVYSFVLESIIKV